jgi:chromosomal replication initiator protein
MRGKRRTSQLALARQVAMYVAKQCTGMTLVEIGKKFGNRDHSTVIYALNRVTEELRGNESLRQTLAQVEEDLRPAAIPRVSPEPSIIPPTLPGM